MIHFKSCPRCLGDIHFRSDQYGAFWQCFQCGLLRDLAQPLARPVAQSGQAGMKMQLPVPRKVRVRRVASPEAN